MDHISDETTYTKLLKDPTELIKGQIFRLLDKHVKAGTIPKTLFSEAKCHQPQYPQLYGLIKIHKEGHPIRRIVAFINTPLTKLSKLLAEIIKPLNNDSQYRLRNTYEFVTSYKSHQEKFKIKNTTCVAMMLKVSIQ